MIISPNKHTEKISHCVVDAVGSRVFFVTAFTIFAKHKKQPTLGTVTIVSHSLRLIRPLFNLHDCTKFCKWLNIARF